MVTRRGVLRWAMGMAACFPMGVEAITRGKLSGVSYAQELDRSAPEMTMETWMSVPKAPGGMLRLSRFREPIYFLDAESRTRRICGGDRPHRLCHRLREHSQNFLVALAT